ncbi:MAG: APC family permease [Ktedonobacteraceae bacterium]
MSIIETTTPSENKTTLRRNSIGLPEVLFQSITTMAPASAVTFSLGAAIPYTGASLPLAVFIALIACALIALNIGALAKYLPSAGGYFTYVSRSLGTTTGWMTGWMFNLAYLFIVPLQLLVLGPVMDSFIQSLFHISFGANGWAVWAVVFAVVVFLLTYAGIKVSANTNVVLGCIEIAVFVVLALWLIITSGSNNTSAVFTPAFSSQGGLGGWQGIFYGMTFVFLAFAGFESSATLAEESRNPRSIVPQAVMFSAILIGIFFVFCSYAGMIGWGVNAVAKTYVTDPNPWDTLAKKVWGPFNLIVIFAILNSALANANSGVIAASRVLFAMGRIGTLPTSLAHTNRFRAPDTAIIFTMIVALVATLIPGLLYGTTAAFAFVGIVITIPIILVYIATCISVPFFYRREHPTEFNVLRHLIVPIVPILVLGAVIYSQVVPLLVPPYQAAPLSYAVPICIAWFVLGLIIVILLRVRAPRILARSNEVYGEETEVVVE